MHHTGLRLAAPLFAGAIMLSACETAPPPPVTLADPGDPCASQFVAYSEAGRLFLPPFPANPTPTPVQMEAALASENAALERLLVSSDTLRHCRAATGSGARLSGDMAEGQRIRQAVETNARGIDTALERVAPGSTSMAASAAQAGGPISAVALVPMTLRMQPDTTSAIAARLPAGARATLRTGPAGFVLADAGGDARGYGSRADFAVVPQVQASNRLVSLAATSMARRAEFARSQTGGRY